MRSLGGHDRHIACAVATRVVCQIMTRYKDPGLGALGSCLTYIQTSTGRN